MSTFILDIDGTIALRDVSNPGVRGHFDWDRVTEDLPNPVVVEVIEAMGAAGHTFIFITGRSDVCEDATVNWIDAHVNIDWISLHMRRANDFRSDVDVKKEIYLNKIANHYKVVGAFEDRARTTAMWRSLGLTVFHVADGNF